MLVLILSLGKYGLGLCLESPGLGVKILAFTTSLVTVAAPCSETPSSLVIVLFCYYRCQAGGDSGDYHVKNYVVPSGGYRRRGAATSSGAQLNITNYNLPITVSYLNYLKQRKVRFCSHILLKNVLSRHVKISYS